MNFFLAFLFMKWKNVTTRLLIPFLTENDFISQDMSVEEIEKILDHPRLKQAFRVSFVGGEPLAHKDIFNMIELCKKKKKLTMIPSNGLLIPKWIFYEICIVKIPSTSYRFFFGKLGKRDPQESWAAHRKVGRGRSPLPQENVG